MNKIYFDIQDDVLIKNVPVPEYGQNTYKQEIVLDKETFIKCYEKWVKPYGNK